MPLFAFEKSIGAVVVFRGEDECEYLLLQYRSGQWDFPKGHQEAGETELATLLREVKEETGLEGLAVLPNFRNSAIYFYSAWGNEKKERIAQRRGTRVFKRVVHYIAETKRQDVKLDFENLDYKWLGFEKALHMLGNKDSKKLIKRVRKYLDSQKES